MRQKAEPITVEAKVTSVGLDEVLEKAHRLQEILVEANSLVDELASKEIKLHIFVIHNIIIGCISSFGSNYICTFVSCVSFISKIFCNFKRLAFSAV